MNPVSTRGLACLNLSVGLMLLAGCRHAGVDAGMPAGDLMAGKGSSRFSVVEVEAPKSSAKAETKEEASWLSEQFTPPKKKGQLRSPAYPEDARRAHAGSVSIGVRIVIGTDGRVCEIGPSPVIATVPGPFQASFLAAVEEAVREWTFSPGTVETFEAGEDLNHDGRPDYKRRASLRPVEVYYDFRFDFSQEKATFKLSEAAQNLEVRAK